MWHDAGGGVAHAACCLPSWRGACSTRATAWGPAAPQGQAFWPGQPTCTEVCGASWRKPIERETTCCIL